jgi:hypothetical protein
VTNAMPEELTYFSQTYKPDGPHEEHRDERLCYLESVKDSKELGRFAEIVAVCTCGLRKKYFAGESHGYVFVCNGGVIMKHRKDGLHVRGRSDLL